MSKFGLGRSLSNLMKGEKVAGQPPFAPGEETGQQEASPGVSSLLRGKQNVFAEPQSDAPAPRKKDLIPLWYFFAADLLLIAFAALVLWKTAEVTWKEVSFCIGAVALGAALSVIAVLKRRSDSEQE